MNCSSLQEHRCLFRSPSRVAEQSRNYIGRSASISAADVHLSRERSAAQGFMLPIIIDAGMVTSLRRAVIRACGEALTFLRVQPIAHSNKAKVWLCLALSAVDLATDAIMRTVPAAEFGRVKLV
jgi:hypothetical protein